MRWLLVATVTGPSLALLMAACVGSDDYSGVEPAADGGLEGSSGGSTSGAIDGASPSDGGGDGGATGACDLTKPFGKPQRIAEVSTNEPEDFARLGPDGTELFISKAINASPSEAGVVQVGGIVVHRKGSDGKWGAASTVALNDLGDGGFINVTALTFTGDSKKGFYRHSDRYGFGAGISETSRLGPGQPWSRGTGVRVTDTTGAVVAAPGPQYPWINDDASRLYYAALVGGAGVKIFQAGFKTGEYGPSKLLGVQEDSRHPVLTRDELTMYFAGRGPHPGTGIGGHLVYRTKRDSLTGDFGPPVFMEELNADMDSLVPTWISPEGCTIYMTGRPKVGSTTGDDVYFATKP